MIKQQEELRRQKEDVERQKIEIEKQRQLELQVGAYLIKEHISFSLCSLIASIYKSPTYVFSIFKNKNEKFCGFRKKCI